MKAKYEVTEQRAGSSSTQEAYTIRDVHSIVSYLVREAKEEGRRGVSLHISIKK